MSNGSRGIMLAGLCLAAISGCGGSVAGPGMADVTGTVTYNGEPVEGANVIFYPVIGDDQTLTSQARTEKDGRFRMTTHVGGGKFQPGIAPGKYSVAISKPDTAAIKGTLTPPKDLLPRRYSNPTTSQLTADVGAGRENNFEFPLADK